jgi:hypothetical protein
MDEIIRDHIIEFGKKREKGQYKQSTVHLYVSNVRNLQKLVQGDVPFDDLEWAKNVKDVGEKLKIIENPQTRRNYVNSLIVSLQTMTYPTAVIREYEVLRDYLNAQYNSSGYLTPNQQKIMEKVSKADILAFLKREIEENLDIILVDQKRLTLFTILSIHTEYPFRNELGDMKVIRHAHFDKLSEEEVLKSNWYVLRRGWKQADFVLTKYKTSGMYGIKTFRVKDPYLRYIHKCFQLREIDLTEVAQQPLFMLNDETLTRNKVSKYLSDYTSQYLGQPIATTLMAKYFGCNPKDPLNPTPAELDRIKHEADLRGHSLATKFQHYLAPVNSG